MVGYGVFSFFLYAIMQAAVPFLDAETPISQPSCWACDADALLLVAYEYVL